MAVVQAKPKFICSYMGLFEYEINGKRYELRKEGHDDGHWNEGVYENSVIPTIGTIRAFCSDDFPPEEVCAMFPGWVPCKWDSDLKKIVYRGDPPQIVSDPLWGGFRAVVELPESA